MTLFRHRFPHFILAAALLILAGCGKQPDLTPATPAPAAVSQKPGSFNILAGSELKDVADVVVAFGRTQGVTVKFEYTGTLDAVDRLSDSHAFDAVWVSHGKYLQLVPAVKSQIKASEKTLYSRVVLGIKPEAAKRLGWQSGKTGWKDILKAIEAGKFRFAMTNPTGSNTGFVALTGLAAELSGKSDALEEKDIPTAALKRFFAGQVMTAGSSGALAEQFAANPQGVDGMVNYESVIRTLAAKGFPLDVIIPAEGVITADYPLMLLAKSEQGGFYQALLTHLRSPPVQQRLAANTYRTPLSGSSDSAVYNELPFPGSLPVIDAILRGFLDTYSRPQASYFVLDVSGSMRGPRISSLKQAITTLTQGDASSAGRFATFRAREHIELTAFSSEIFPTQVFDLTADSKTNREVLERIDASVRNLEAKGGTAIYDALMSIYPGAQAALRREDRAVSIVLITDGENTVGSDFNRFQQFVNEHGAPRVPVFGVLYGEASAADMQALAKLTGGRVFDARTTSLARALKDIRSFQ
ncbi:MAG: VWA domain-containing protein [Betaproteobacteria bacterium]|nr:VWA domain-containing protein [Betaproteobacteria bacterium]